MIFANLLSSQIWMLAFSVSITVSTEQREWTDASGHYKFDAELVAWSDDKAVFQKENDDLISMAIRDLSEADQAFVAARKADELSGGQADELQTWVMQDGFRINGRVVDFAKREVAIRRHLGNIFVNDRQFDNLPPIYRELIPRLVAHFEKTEVDGQDGLDRFLKQHPLRTKTYQAEGVLLELENGDRYVVPFFMFSDRDASFLRTGWQRWQEAHEAEQVEQREEESFYLRAQAESWQPDPSLDEAKLAEMQRMRQVSEVSLQLQAYDAGLFDLWEVQLRPANNWGRWQSVVVPGRNSDQAAQAALQKFPGSRVGSIAKVRRR